MTQQPRVLLAAVAAAALLSGSEALAFKPKGIKAPAQPPANHGRREALAVALAAAFGGPSASLAATSGTTLPMDIGVIGLRKEGATGRLNTCPDSRAGRGCISTSDKEEDTLYVPPWTYRPEGGYGQVVTTKSAEPKTMAEAQADLRAAVAELPGAEVVETKLDGRYVRVEVTTPRPVKLPGQTDTVDDLEFLFEPEGRSDPPALVNYRSAARPGSGGDSKKQRERIKQLRVKLQDRGWASIGRFIT